MVCDKGDDFYVDFGTRNGSGYLNFEDGKIVSQFATSSHLYQLAKKGEVLNKSSITTELKYHYKGKVQLPFPLKTFQEYFPKTLPALQEKGLLFSDQYHTISNYLDGRIQLHFEPNNGNEKLLLLLGVKPDFKEVFDTTLVKGFVLDASTGFYVDEEDFQKMRL